MPSVQDTGDTYDASRLLASEIRTFFSCVMFLTRLPCGTLADHHPTFLMRSMAYFPVMGVIIGSWGAAWYCAAEALFETYTAAIVSTMATVWLTGVALGLSSLPCTPLIV
jgi:adenosylcobinamide-GDP ribazoletransferase